MLTVVKDEGPNFYVEVEKVPVPEIGNGCSQHLEAYAGS